MASEPEPKVGNPFGLIIILGIGLLLFRGCPVTPPVTPEPPGPVEPVEPTVNQPTAADVWSALAHCVETKAIGGDLQQNTDHLVKLAEILKDSGTLPDTSRVDSWRLVRIEITDANRAQIVATLRGK